MIRIPSQVQVSKPMAERFEDRTAKCLALLFHPNQLTGPLSVLEKAMRSRARVVVVTRYKNGVRGVLSGVVVVFDKHFNVVLRDVDEQYTVLHKTPCSDHHHHHDGAGDGEESMNKKGNKWKKSLKYYKRHLPRVLLRGESIVLVSLNASSSVERYFKA